MNNYKTVGKIAAGSAIVCFAFAALTAFITYEAILISNPSIQIPASYIQLSMASSMLPFLLLAIISLITAIVTLRAGKETPQTEAPETEAQPVTQSEEIKL
jgi:TRAP-type C4-dicarboxylate transport system permease small subunit